MAAIVNGLALSKLRAYGATFFIFSDYARPAMRLSALMELPAHLHLHARCQWATEKTDRPISPVEHLASLRAIPGLVTLRPGDANEVGRGRTATSCGSVTSPAVAGAVTPAPCRRSIVASTRRHPGWRMAAYVLADAPEGNPEVILIASGSELILAVNAHEKTGCRGYPPHEWFSMPSWEIFENQTRKYRQQRATS